MDIIAPDATVADPLVLTFTLFSLGTDPNSVEMFKNGVLIESCTGSGATPDPCVESRAPQGADNTLIVVRTSMASLWNLPEPGLLLQLASGLLGLAVLDRRRRRANR